MKLSLEELIGKSPKELTLLKHRLLRAFRFQDAETVDEYIKHCINLNRIVKNILK